MLEIRVGDDTYGLADETAARLVRRVELATPQVGGEPEPGTTFDKLRDAHHGEVPAELDDGDLALLGVVLEAWFQETSGELPGDAEEFRLAIARHLD